MSGINFNSGVYNLTGNNIGLDPGDRPIECRGVWITLEDAMTFLGAEVGEEVAVQSMIDQVTALLREYLGRSLLDCTHTDRFFRPNTQSLYLVNWPVGQVHSIRIAGVRQDTSAYEIDPDLGVLYPTCGDGSRGFNRCAGSLTINYDAGYIPPPATVQSVFRSVLSGLYDAGGTATGGVGPIKKVSLTGVAMVEFQSTVSYSGVDQQAGVPDALKEFTGILDLYKSDRTMAVVA